MQPEHVKHVDAALIVQDQVGDHALVLRPERQGADRAIGVVVVDRVTTPRADLQQGPQLGIAGERGRG